MRLRAKARAAPRPSSFIPRAPSALRSGISSKQFRRAALSDTAPGTAPLRLREKFPPVPTEAWEAAIRGDLKGADYDKKLLWRSEEGIAVRPYYRAGDLAGIEAQIEAPPGNFPFVRGGGKS